MIVWRSDPETGGKWALLGEDVQPAGESADVEVVDTGASTSSTAAGVPHAEMAEASGSNLLKRPLSPSIDSTSYSEQTSAKRARRNKQQSNIAEEFLNPRSSLSARACHAPQLNPDAQRALASSSKGPFLSGESSTLRIEHGESDADLFLSEGWRERW